MVKLFNTLSRRKDEFKPLKPKRVGIYTCGPTVYDYAHIGNLRSYVVADVLVRTLRYFGYRVRWVMNITDIDDKTIAGAKRAGTTLKAFTTKYTKIFFEDLNGLNIAPANEYPRATEHVTQMREIIERLKRKGIAYETEDGIYFDISKFRGYGKLSGLKKRDLKPGARVDVDAYDKRSPGDFALWKYNFQSNKQPTTNNQQLLKVDGRQLSVAGAGRPGWHLECSAMSRTYLGQPFDIHTGGVDLVFPHHENEIAQSVGAYSKPLAHYFIHNEHLLVEGKKMAKSEGSFVTLADVMTRGYDPLALRYLFLTAHYRDKLNFTWESFTAAEESLRHIRQTMQRKSQIQNLTLRQARGDAEQGRSIKSQINLKSKIIKLKTGIETALADDLNTPKALAQLHNANDDQLWLNFDSILGLNLKPSTINLTSPQRRLIQKREQLRKAGKFSEADEVRKQLKKQGITIEDTPRGPRVLTKT